ncbi:MAG: hypothetical protein AAGE94_05195 [Acidobacteriota bacterium]
MSVSTLDPSTVTIVGLRCEAARRLGCEVRNLDPETGYLYEVRRGDLRRLLFGGKSPLNDAVAARLAGDKFHTALALADRGLRVPAMTRCLQPGHFRPGDYPEQEGFSPAERFVEAHGLPVVVKPNAGSRGRDISVIEDRADLVPAIEQVWQRDYLALIQEPIDGFDLRVDLLDGQSLFAYTRQPVRIEGDGQSTVRELFAGLDRRFRGETFERHLLGDALWREHAEAAGGLDLDHVLDAGWSIGFDTPILNLNRLCLGQRLDPVPEPWLDLVRGIADAMHLRHIGVDLKIHALDQDPNDAVVIEVNASPSLVHMARTGHFEDAVAAEMRVVAAALGE